MVIREETGMGGSQDSGTPTAQGHEADNLSEVAL